PQTEELHQQVGDDRAGISHGVRHRIVGGMAEAWIGDVPRPECGEAEAGQRKRAEACGPYHLSVNEPPETIACVADRHLRGCARTHENSPSDWPASASSRRAESSSRV